MIKLSKVKLINWMYFQNQTLTFGGNTVFAGVNGSGKSTIIDAIQMLFLGNKASKFNSNANAEKRTLESYVRGAVTTMEKEFLRPGDVVCYLVMEVEENEKTHLFGINIEYRYSTAKLSDPRYFYISNTSITDELFIENNFPRTYDNLIKNFKNNNVEYQTLHTLLSYQSKIKEVFGLKDEKKYFNTLSRAIGIKNINDCNTFIQAFVLDENPIDVTDIKNTLQSMRKLSQIIADEEGKELILNKICKLYDEITFTETEILRNKVTINLMKTELLGNENAEFSKIIEHNEAKILDLKKMINQLENENKILLIRLKELQDSLDEISPNLASKQRELEKAYVKLDETRTNLNTLNVHISNELPNINELISLGVSDFKEYYKYLKSNDFNSNTFKRLTKDYQLQTTNVLDYYKTIKNDLSKKIEQVRNELESLIQKKKNLESKRAVIDPQLLRFKEYLQTELCSKYNTNVEVLFLYECLDISCDEWRDAIEGYLNKQRFYIVVEQKYFKEALRLYHSKKDFYLTNIIDSSKIPSIEAKENTLGYYIKASNEVALNYARYILNRVITVSSINELNQHEIAITKDCMRYQNYSVGRINPKFYREQYIGEEGLRRTLKVIETEIAKANEEAIKLRDEYHHIVLILEKLQTTHQFTSNILENNDYINSIDEEKRLYEEINLLEEEIVFYKNNPKYLEITEKIAETSLKLDKNKNFIINYQEQVAELNKENAVKENLISSNNETILQLYEELEEWEVDDIYEERERMHTYKISKKEVEDLKYKNVKLDKLLNGYQNEIIICMREANSHYLFPYEPSLRDIEKYIDEKNKIRTEIFEYKNNFIDYQTKIRLLFFDGFLSKLFNSIEEAKKNISNLNHALSKYQFGSDFYVIKHAITENTDLQMIYNYAKKYNEDSERSLLNFDSMDGERSRIEKLINDYFTSDDLSIREKIVDYRNYLDFDIHIHNTDNNTVKSFKKVFRVQSGGEVQVPFYILSAVAFHQTLDPRREGLAVVLYDEAFDKMDSQRIHSMLSFYKGLNIQLLMAMPGKLDSVVENVETIYAICREGECAIAGDVTHELCE